MGSSVTCPTGGVGVGVLENDRQFTKLSNVNMFGCCILFIVRSEFYLNVYILLNGN